jgi:phosphoglycolate phosphatase
VFDYFDTAPDLRYDGHMSQSFRKIKREICVRLKLMMADVDGTLTAWETIGSPVSEVISRLERRGISFGLVSGRTLPRLDPLALELGIKGPIIAENGGLAKLNVNQNLIDLGYSRQPALAAFSWLKELFPGSIRELPDNRDRQIDISFSADGIQPEEIRKYLKDVQVLDSGYMLHLLPDGISKGSTLKRLLTEFMKRHISPDEVMVFGDSATDVSLFTEFPNSVLIINPSLSDQNRKNMLQMAAFHSERTFGDGFLEVAEHVLQFPG